MSLLEEAFEDYVYMNKTAVDDGYGSIDVVYQDGPTIQGAMVFNNSLQAKVAGAQGVSSIYTLTTRKSLTLEYHDVIRRVRDNKIFRVTSDGDDSYTPASANLDMRQVSCEEWKLPNSNNPSEDSNG